jgi:hypothetical protein
MNNRFLQSAEKSLRQFAHPRYNVCVEIHAQAPIEAPILFLVTPQAPKPVSKPFILKDLRTLKIPPHASHSFQDTCTLFIKQPGVYPPTPHFGTDPRRRHRAAPAPPYSRVRSPERGPWQPVLAPPRPTKSSVIDPAFRPVTDSPAPIQAIPIFTCNKKAIYSTIAGNAAIANDVYKVFSRTVPRFRRYVR